MLHRLSWLPVRGPDLGGRLERTIVVWVMEEEGGGRGSMRRGSSSRLQAAQRYWCWHRDNCHVNASRSWERNRGASLVCVRAFLRVLELGRRVFLAPRPRQRGLP